MKVLIATKNKGKIEKYSGILHALGIECCTLEDIDLDIEVNETGNNTTENAIIKAKAYYEKVNIFVTHNDYRSDNTFSL